MQVFDELESEVRSYCRAWPTVFDRARGQPPVRRDGQRYLDFFAGAGALNYGHNHPVLIAALLDYLERDGVMHSLDMATAAKADFLQTFDDVVLEPRGPRLQGPVPRADRHQRGRGRAQAGPQGHRAREQSSASPTASTA